MPDRELLKLLPNVLRARDFHLYLEGGIRLTDLWLFGGKAVLGHKPPGLLRELKNAAERGLFSPFPHPLEKRLLKALGRLFPERVFRLYPDESSLYRALEKAGFSDDNTKVSLWRPFLDMPEGIPIMIPVLPWPLGPAALVLDKSAETLFPAGELISPVLLAPAVRALNNLMSCKRTVKYPRIDKALKNSLWHRQGIYLTCNLDKESYAAMFRRFLEGGFLIPPSPEEPAILPSFMSKGEETKLAEAFSAESAIVL